MRQILLSFIIGVFALSVPLAVQAAPKARAKATASSADKKKKVIYRKYTQLDFTGESVQGQAKAPEIFYVFQRRRAGGIEAARAPSSLSHQKTTTFNELKGALVP